LQKKLCRPPQTSGSRKKKKAFIPTKAEVTRQRASQRGKRKPAEGKGLPPEGKKTAHAATGEKEEGIR